MNLFGFEIKKQIDAANDDDLKKKDLTTFIPREEDEVDSTTISTGAGYYGTYVDINGDSPTSEKELILKYRDAALMPEVDLAINDIVDEAITTSKHGAAVDIILDDLPYEDTIKGKIRAEFKNIVRKLNFTEDGTELFRRWYIDGRLYFQVIVDRNKPKDGIVELRQIDPTKIKKVREIKEEFDKRTNTKISEVVHEYYVYTEGFDSNKVGGTNNAVGVKIELDAIICVTSGLTDPTRKKRISHLHKALKVVNQLRVMEDSLVIYRLARAPERRIFYIDTGNLPKGKSEEYIQKVMSKFRNKIVYDANTGEIKDQKKHMAILEDFWLPRREGRTSTEIDTLPGGAHLNEIDDIIYFKQQLYKALNIPITRLEPDNAFTSGRSTEITRDEVKFQKFINRLRRRFSYLFLDALKTQLQLKGIVSETDWNDIVQDIRVDFKQDNHFFELMQIEILKDRLDILRDLQDQVGKYYSIDWLRRNVLQQSDEEVKLMDKQIAIEKENGLYPDENSSSRF